MKINDFKCTVAGGTLLFKEKIHVKEDLIIENSIQFMDDIETTETIDAKFDLIVHGNLTADSVIVKGDLLCLGDLKCKSLEVGGKALCLGGVYTDVLYSYSDLIVSSGSVQHVLSVKGNLLVTSTFEMNCRVNCTNLICLEGLYGDGEIESKLIISKEYCEVAQIDAKLLILDEGIEEDYRKSSVGITENTLESSKINYQSEISALLTQNDEETIWLDEFLDLKSELYKKISQWFSFERNIKDNIANFEDYYEFDDIEKMLCNLSGYSGEFFEAYEFFRKINILADKSKVSSIKEYLDILEMNNNIPPMLKKVSLIYDTLGYLIEKGEKSIRSLPLGINNHIDMLNVLVKIENNRVDFSSGDYVYTLNRIFREQGLGRAYLSSYLESQGYAPQNNGSTDDYLKKVKQIIEQEILDVYNNKIEVVKIAGSKGNIKVAVRAIEKGLDPVQCCVGHRGCNIEHLSTILEDEKISFVEWSDNLNEFIRSTLRVGRSSKIVIDEAERKVKVQVPHGQAALVIGKGGSNVRSASDLVGWKIMVSE